MTKPMMIWVLRLGVFPDVDFDSVEVDVEDILEKCVNKRSYSRCRREDH